MMCVDVFFYIGCCVCGNVVKCGCGCGLCCFDFVCWGVICCCWLLFDCWDCGGICSGVGWLFGKYCFWLI